MLDNKIIVSFDENVNKQTIPGAVFISPRPAGEIDYKLKGNNLHIVLPDSFKDSTTYIVTVGSEIRDLRGNGLEKSYSFAFSTGPDIAKGTIEGRVFNNSKAASGVTVGLWPLEGETVPDGIDTLYPPYMTQSGKEGEYRFEYIPDGRYFILAYIDKNKNQLFNYPKETFGIPDRFPEIGDAIKPSDIVFNLTTEDTVSRIDILSVVTTPENLVKVRLTGKVNGRLIDDNLSKIKVVRVADSTSITANSFKEPPETEHSTYNFYFGSMSEGEYYILFDGDFMNPGDSIETLLREFQYAPKEDDNPPLIENASHNQRAVFPSDSIIEFVFSEPMSRLEQMEEGLRIIDTMTQKPVKFSYDWKDHFRLEVSLPGVFWGEAYRIDMNEKEFKDIAGNALGDSLRSFEFSVYDLDSLGEISGSIEVDSSIGIAGIPRLELTDLSGRIVIEEPVPSGEFRFSVAPGKYFLRGFLDRNGNGEMDLGHFKPFEFSETTSRYPDTIRVRYRFETAGIVLEFK